MVLFWHWAGYSSTFTIAVWLKFLQTNYGESSSIGKGKWSSTAIRVAVSVAAVAGLIGMAYVWSRARGDADLLNATALWIGIVLGFLSLKYVRVK